MRYVVPATALNVSTTMPDGQNCGIDVTLRDAIQVRASQLPVKMEKSPRAGPPVRQNVTDLGPGQAAVYSYQRPGPLMGVLQKRPPVPVAQVLSISIESPAGSAVSHVKLLALALCTL